MEPLEGHRRLLYGLCYRMTGSAADAEDIVQETFARALTSPPPDTGRPLRPWLVKVAANLARDQLRRRKRQAYVGPWLPSPVELETEADELRPDARYDLAESATFGFLLALEALTPGQRAVLLLRDVLDCSVEETAQALDMSEGGVKTMHHRARAAMARYDRDRAPPSAELQTRTRGALEALFGAIAAGDPDRLAELLANDARALTDGGGEVLAALRPVRGREKVLRFLLGLVGKYGPPASIEWRNLNGLPGVLATYERDKARLANRFVIRADVDEAGRISELHVVLTESKLSAVM